MERKIASGGHVSMKVQRLESRVDGAVAAVMVTAAGEEIRVNFTVLKNGITMVNPDWQVFDGSDLDAAGVPAIAAAVVAFDAVATYSSGHGPE